MLDRVGSPFVHASSGVDGGSRTVYRVEGWQGSVVADIVVLALVLGMVAFTSIGKGPIHATVGIGFSAFVIGVTVREWYRTAHRIETDDSTLLFVSRFRKVEVAWAEVVSVSPPRQLKGMSGLVWSLTDGRRLRSKRNLGGIHRLATELERRGQAQSVEI
ncbi:MAG: hypothetical protein JWN39_2662 [Ilumatobacteraceae bacterium]|nr:hypothetical protein [Ilumatobacteraceae bacterium]